MGPENEIDTSGITFAAQEAPYLEGEVVEETKPETFKLTDPDVEEKLKALFESQLAREVEDTRPQFYTNRAARRAVIKANRRRR
jgi:hypothetical protein